jgi:hypothetical protein
MPERRKHLAAGLVTVVALATAVVAAPQADADINQCGASSICAWEDFGFSGGFTTMQQQSSTFAGKAYDNGQSVNNSISSARNNSVYYYCLYTNINFTGTSVIFPPNTQLSSLGSDVNDKFRSGRVNESANC